MVLRHSGAVPVLQPPCFALGALGSEKEEEEEVEAEEEEELLVQYKDLPSEHLSAEEQGV